MRTLLLPLAAHATVDGRYVRIDSLSRAMELSELELYAGGSNLLRGQPELLTGGLGFRLHGPFQPSEAQRIQRVGLTNGNLEPSQRGSVGVPEPGSSLRPHPSGRCAVSTR